MDHSHDPQRMNPNNFFGKLLFFYLLVSPVAFYICDFEKDILTTIRWTDMSRAADAPDPQRINHNQTSVPRRCFNMTLTLSPLWVFMFSVKHPHNYWVKCLDVSLNVSRGRTLKTGIFSLTPPSGQTLHQPSADHQDANMLAVLQLASLASLASQHADGVGGGPFFLEEGQLSAGFMSS